MRTGRTIASGLGLSVLVIGSVVAAPQDEMSDGLDDARLTFNPDMSLVGPGLRLAAGGMGMKLGAVGEPPAPPGLELIELQVAGPVQRAFLYWGGRRDLPGDDTLLMDGVPVTGELIGAEGPVYAYRADVTTQVQTTFTPPGLLVVSVTNPAVSNDLDGASLVVIYEDPTDSSAYEIQLFDGCDYAYRKLAPGP